MVVKVAKTGSYRGGKIVHEVKRRVAAEQKRGFFLRGNSHAQLAATRAKKLAKGLGWWERDDTRGRCHEVLGIGWRIWSSYVRCEVRKLL